MRDGDPRARRAQWALIGLLTSMYWTLASVRDWTNAVRALGLLRAMVMSLFALCGVVVLILATRALRALRPSDRLRLVAALVIAGTAYALALRWTMTPEENLHLIEYGLVGVLLHRSFPAQAWRRGPMWRLPVLFVASAAMGWLDEGIQGALPNRQYDIRDVGFNAFAACMALSMASLIGAFTRRGG